MSIQLDTLEQRIVGVLIEKEMTVPDTYPLSVNALVAGCNQKNNRDPLMQVEDFDVEGALRSLMDKGWVTRREILGSRVMRYAHEARSQLGVDEGDLAILCELLCRGAQAPGALKTRCQRMHDFPGPAEVEARLADLSARPVPYVEELARQPRERQARWQHLLGPAAAPSARADDEPTSSAPAARPAPAVPRYAEALSPAVDSADLEARVDALEQVVAELRERLDRLGGM